MYFPDLKNLFQVNLYETKLYLKLVIMDYLMVKMKNYHFVQNYYSVNNIHINKIIVKNLNPYNIKC